MPSRSRRRARKRRIWLIGGSLFLIAFVLAAAGWRDLLSARSRLQSAKATLDQIVAHPTDLNSAEGRSSTTQQLANAFDEVHVARSILDHSVSLEVARFVPFVSAQRSGLLRLVDDSGSAVGAGQDLVTEADQVVVQGKVNGGQIPLAELATLEAALRAAGTKLSRLSRPTGGLLGPLAKARRQFNTLTTVTGSRLLNDADAVHVGQQLLGVRGPRTYFVALENNAEMRDQGAVLAFALLSADNGHVRVTQHGSLLTPLQIPGKGVTTTLLLNRPAPTAIPQGTAAVFGSLLPTETWQSVNATADFDFTAKAIQDMYHQASGLSVDGVIAIDVPALSSLLSVVGPVAVPGISEEITAESAGRVLLHDLYNSFANDQQAVRKELLSEVATEVVNRLSTESFEPLPLAQQLASAASGGHMRVWSGVVAEEATLEKVGLGGGPGSSDPDRTFHLAVENRNATKLDYYVQTAAHQQVTVTPNGTAIVRTTVTVSNGAPRGAKPSYQLGPDGFGTTQPGEYWAWVLLWGPSGANQPGSVPESGLQLSNTVLDRIYAGQSKQAGFVTVIPNAVRNGKLDLRYVPQARLSPGSLSVTVEAPGWSLSGSPTWAGNWDRTINLSWGLHR